MADLSPVIETMEHRWMRAWVSRDARDLKSLTARNFRLVMGSKPGAILDFKSLIEASTTRFLCDSYRFGDIYIRDHGGMAIFATQLEIKASMDGQDWSGRYWVTDLWRKGRVRRRWHMVERILSRPEEKADVPAAIKSLQLWR
jgi:Domain of unknown function (DUF4440)